MYYTPDEVTKRIEKERNEGRVYDPEMGSGRFLAVMGNPPYETEDEEPMRAFGETTRK